MRHDRDRLQRALACASEVVQCELSGIEVFGRASIEGKLDANGKLATEQRAEVIKAVRAGEHVELAVNARTFRQKAGHPNTRYLRHTDEHLPALAASYVGMPFLLDHRSWDQEARMGTIIESVLHDHGGTGWRSLDQKLRVVKPHGVISVLDGTLDRFSIGWVKGTGDVLCTVHKQSIYGTGACNCWPGDVVTVDGKKQVVEWEFTHARGTEVSGVNSPAVFDGTGIHEIRAALCEELGLSDRDLKPDNHQENTMNFTRLAALLGLTSLMSAADEDRALSAIENQKRALTAAEQERDTAKTALAAAETRAKTAETALAAERETALKAQVDAIIETAYRDGKLRMNRDDKGNALASAKEPRLRRIAKQDGLDALRAELAEMDVVVPVGQRVLNDDTRQPERNAPVLVANMPPREILADVAEQLGLKVEDLEANYRVQEG